MKRLGNIWDKVCDLDNLKEAHKEARKDKLFYNDVQMVDSDPDKYLKIIQEQLINKTYEVSPYKYKIIIDMGKQREIYKLPYFPDRIIQWALMLQIQDYLEKTMIASVCASRPKKGITYAHHLLLEYLREFPEETVYCMQLDIHKFYPSINKEICKQKIAKKIKDKDALWLINKIIDSHQESGIPIGSYLSQYLANFYLNDFDHWLKEQKHQKFYIRYMDDIVILGSNKEELHKLHKEIEEYLANLDLELNKKWQIYPIDKRAIDFVGFTHNHEVTRLRKSSAKRLKKKFRRVLHKVRTGKNITYNEWCSFNSYKGWLFRCDAGSLYAKYLWPLEGAMHQYYLKNIKNIKKRSVF